MEGFSRQTELDRERSVAESAQDDELYIKLISACLIGLDGCLGENKHSVASVDKPDVFATSPSSTPQLCKNA